MTALRIGAVVLAGGSGTRLGATVPKPLVPLAGRPMIGHVLSRIPAAVSPVLISANDAAAFGGLGHVVVPDRLPGRQGPLAGLDAAAAWLRANGTAATHLLCLPGDTPFLTAELMIAVTRLPGERPAMARFENRPQPTVALWPLTVLDALASYLPTAGNRSVMQFATLVGPCDMIDIAPVADAPGGDPFFNVNTPADLALARTNLDGRQG